MLFQLLRISVASYKGSCASFAVAVSAVICGAYTVLAAGILLIIVEEAGGSLILQIYPCQWDRKNRSFTAFTQ